jgi:hypothetical protein
MQNAWRRSKMHTKFLGKLKEGDHFECLSLYGSIIINEILKECWVRMWSDFKWKGAGTSGCLS